MNALLRFLEILWRFAWLMLLSVFFYATWPAWEFLLRFLGRFTT